MSLALLADDLASRGRNGDSMLVHMTPGEVKGLQALALAHGGSLTINPETGLPEANFLKKLLPTIAGFALNAFAPGVGTAIGAALGTSAAVGTGVAVGGLTALATGSLSRGLAAGLGAYGGAGISSALADAGASALGTEAFNAAAKEGVTNEAVEQAVRSRIGEASMADKLGAGFRAATDSPKAFMDFAKPNFGTLYSAAAPAMMADQSVPTKTQMPGDTGYIRQYSFDPYSQQYTPVGVYPASEYGKEQPPGMANGGVVAFANGGFTDAQVAAYIRDQGLSGGEVAKAAQAFGISADQLSRAQGLLSSGAPAVQQASQSYAAQVADRPDLVQQNLEFYDPNAASRAVRQWVTDNPSATREQIDAAMKASGASAQDVADATRRAGLSAATTWSALSNPQGLAGMNASIRNAAAQALATGDYTAEQARAPMQLYGVTEEDVKRATGMSLDELFKRPTIRPNLPISPTGPNESYTKEDINKGWWGGTGEPVVGVKEWDPMGRIQRPIPRDIAQHEEWYNRLTGGSQQAYDYLMGRGAYPTRPFSASGAVARPYGEVIMGLPASTFNTPVIFDPETRTYKPNPNYKKPEPLKTATSTGTGTGTKAFTGGDPRAMFDEAGYLAANPDVAEEIKSGKANFGDAYGHFLTYGLKEGRQGGVADIEAFKRALEAYNLNMTSGGGDSGIGGVSDGGSSGGGGMSNSGEGGPDGVGGWARGGRVQRMALGGLGGLGALAAGGSAQYNLGDYSDGGRLLKGPGDGVSDSIPATIGGGRPARLADGEFVVPARIVSELGNGSTDAGARKLYAMMDRVQRARGKTTGKGKVAKDTSADKYLPA